MAEQLLIHNVYFSLIDRSDAARQKLLRRLRRHLPGHPRHRLFACGRLAESSLAK